MTPGLRIIAGQQATKHCVSRRISNFVPVRDNSAPLVGDPVRRRVPPAYRRCWRQATSLAFVSSVCSSGGLGQVDVGLRAPQPGAEWLPPDHLQC